MIRVLVWASSRVTQAGLEAIVEADPRFAVVRRPAQARALPAAAQEAEPDVILLDSGDLARPSANHEDPPGIPVVVLAETNARSEILRLLHSGVRGIVLQEAPPDEIAAALVAVADGLAALSPEILEALFPPGESALDEETLLPEALTPRESEVLALLAAGASNKEIAGKLHLSEHTVKFHVSTILGKLGAATRAEAVARGYRQGLIVI